MTKDGRRLDVALTISPVRDDFGHHYRRLEDRTRHHGRQTDGGRADPSTAGDSDRHGDAEQRRRHRGVGSGPGQGGAGGHRCGHRTDDGRVRRVLLQPGKRRRRVLHAVYDFRRAARSVLGVSDAAQHRSVRADVQRNGRGPKRGHHQGFPLRSATRPITGCRRVTCRCAAIWPCPSRAGRAM